MKKFIVIVSFLLISLSSYSQYLYYGLEVGYGTYPKIKKSHILSFAGTFTYSFENEIIALRSGVSVDLRRIPLAPEASSYFHEQMYNYVTVPLMLQVYAGSEDQKIYIGSGPYASALVSEPEYYDVASHTVKKYDVLNAGLCNTAGVWGLLNDNTVVTMEIRYNIGLLNNGPAGEGSRTIGAYATYHYILH